MKPAPESTLSDEDVVLNLFCSREGEAWRLFFWPTWLPRYIHEFLDERGQVYPVELDFDDLESHMSASRAEYEKRTSKVGGVETPWRFGCPTHWPAGFVPAETVTKAQLANNKNAAGSCALDP
jgi:hypothetical protein